MSSIRSSRAERRGCGARALFPSVPWLSRRRWALALALGLVGMALGGLAHAALVQRGVQVQISSSVPSDGTEYLLVGELSGVSGATYAEATQRLEAEELPVLVLPHLGTGVSFELNRTAITKQVTQTTGATSRVLSLRGVARRAAPIIGNGRSQVLILASWPDATSRTPVVTTTFLRQNFADLARSPLGLTGVAGSLEVRNVSVTIGNETGAEPTSLAPSSLAFKSNLPPNARQYFFKVYGKSTPVFGALEHATSAPYLASSFSLDQPLFDTVGEAFGVDAGTNAVLSGRLPVTIDRPFTAGDGNWSFGASISKSGTAPFGLDAVLGDNPVATTWSFDLGYDGTRRTTTATIGGGFQSDLLGGVPLEAVGSVSYTPASGSIPARYGVELLARMGLGSVWADPFDLGLIDEVTDVEVRGSYAKSGDTTTVGAGISGRVVLAGRAVTLGVSGKMSGDDFSVDASANLGGDPITVADVASLLGANLTGAPANALGSVGISNVGVAIHVERDTPEPNSTTTTIPGTPTWKFSVAGTGEGTVRFSDSVSLSARVLFMAGNDGVTVAARPSNKLELSSLLSVQSVDLPEITIVDDAAGAAFGVLVSTTEKRFTTADYPSAVGEYFRPLYGQPTDSSANVIVNVPAGVGAAGSFVLPNGLAGALEKIGVEGRLTVNGSIGLFGAAPGMDLRGALTVVNSAGDTQLQRALMFIDQVQLTAALKLSGASLSLEVSGSTRLKLPAGIPVEAVSSDVIDDLPGDAFQSWGPASECPTGSTLLTIPGTIESRCFQLLRMSVTGALGVRGTAEFFVSLGLTLQDENLGTFHPLGFRYAGIERLSGYLKVSATPAGGFGIGFGFDGSGNLSIPEPGTDTDLVFDGSLAFAGRVQVMPLTPPIVTFVPEGFRLQTRNGVSVGQLVRLGNVVVQQNPDGQLLPVQDIPNIGIRNATVSLSLLPGAGIPALCIPEGIAVGGELTIGAFGPDYDAPECGEIDLGSSEPDQSQCRRDQGCLAAMFFRLSTSGVEGRAFLGDFTTGPIRWQDLDLLFRADITGVRLGAGGSMRIRNLATTANRIVAEGRFNATFDTGSTQLDAVVDLVGGLASGFLHIEGSVSPFDVSRFGQLNAQLGIRTGELDALQGFVSLVGAIESQLDNALDLPREVLETAAGAADAFDSNAGDGLRWLANQTDAPDLPLTAGARRVGDAFDDFMSIVRKSPVDINDVASKFLRGVTIPGTSIHVPGVCRENTIDVTIFGIHYAVPAISRSEYPELYDADGKCRTSLILSGLVYPAFEKSIEAVTGVDVDIEELLDTLANVDLTRPLADLCLAGDFAFDALQRGASSPLLRASVYAEAKVFGIPTRIRSALEIEGIARLSRGSIDEFMGRLLDSLTVDTEPARHAMCTMDAAAFAANVDSPVTEEDVVPGLETARLQSITADGRPISGTVEVVESQRLNVGLQFGAPYSTTRGIFVNWGSALPLVPEHPDGYNRLAEVQPRNVWDQNGDGVLDTITYYVRGDVTSWTIPGPRFADDTSVEPFSVVVSDVTGQPNPLEKENTRRSMRVAVVNTIPNLKSVIYRDGSGIYRPLDYKASDAATRAPIPEGEEVVVRATLADQEGDPLTLLIEWGDGTSSVQESSCTSRDDLPWLACDNVFDFSHRYLDEPWEPMTLTLLDDDGGRRTSQRYINVVNRAPYDGSFIANGRALVGDLRPYTAEFTDVREDTHFVTFDWGDGSENSNLWSNAAGWSETLQSDGVSARSTASRSHAFAEPGKYTVTIYIFDHDDLDPPLVLKKTIDVFDRSDF